MKKTLYFAVQGYSIQIYLTMQSFWSSSQNITT